MLYYKKITSCINAHYLIYGFIYLQNLIIYFMQFL